MVSNVHSIASGSGLHISVPSHVTIVTADTYPASHWMVTVDPGNLLETCPNAPFMGLVNIGQLPEKELTQSKIYILNILTTPKVVLSSCTVPSTVGSHNTDIIVYIVLSSHSDRGGCEDSSRELGRR